MSVSRKNDIFNDIFKLNFESSNHTPRANVSRQKHGILLEVELPGFSKSDIGLDTSNNVLTVTANKTKSDKDYDYREFGLGMTKRSWTLPRDVDAERIDATYDAGILAIDIPYRVGTGDNRRKIEIR